ncbi:redoxin domain-containing protein [Candidatus Daviesbacteria bacterium]|nr:redoxin domain-containing protein [Candidatus Daviesbacteria bacterium]
MNNKTVIFVIVLALIVGAIVFLSKPFGGNQPSPVVKQESGQNSSEIGQKTADFELEDFNGNKVKLSDFRGKPVFIDFWAAWCPFCVEEMPEIDKVHKEFGDKLVVLGIHRSETEEIGEGAQFAQERGVTYTLLKDSTGQVYKTFTGGRNFMPYAVYIDKDGVIRSIKAGPKTAEEIKKNVEELIR